MNTVPEYFAEIYNWSGETVADVYVSEEIYNAFDDVFYWISHHLGIPRSRVYFNIVNSDNLAISC